MMFDWIESQLNHLAAQQLIRQPKIVQTAASPRMQVDGRAVLAFCSNDYLGLANHPVVAAAAQQAIVTAGVGAGAAHLVSGHHQHHEDLGHAAAAFVGYANALLFSTGYMANLGVVTALLGRGDAIFVDKLNHASLNDAMQLSRAQVHRFPHQDINRLEALLAASPAPKKLIAVDAVFSMDGDIAHLPELLNLAERYDALLYVDDAHGFGVLGAQGRGSLSHFNLQSDRIIYMATLGKAAGVAGAFVAAHPMVLAWLQQKARTAIYTTAMPPLLAAASQAALGLIANSDEPRAHLQRLIAHLQAGCADLPWALLPSQTPIQPLLIGSAADAMRISQALWQQGLWVPAIRPPTVPQGTARLRIALSAAHSLEDVDALLRGLRALSPAA